MERQELLNDGGELGRQQFVGLIHHKGRAFGQIGNAFAGQVKYSSGSSHKNVNSIIQPDNVIHQASSTGSDHDVDAQMLSKGLTDL